MQLNWLEDFAELARTRNFTRAAENRFVTHPAFGRRIRALEEWVGTRLIERSQPVQLTAAGMVFLEAANNALEILLDARTQLQDTVPSLKNNLRIVTGRSLASTFFPDWYHDVVRRFGSLSAIVSTGGSEEAILRLASGEADLLISYASPLTQLMIDQKQFDCLPVAREQIVPVSAPNGNGKALFDLSSQKPFPWLAFARSLALRAVLARHLADLPKPPNLRPVYQSDSYESIMAMAKRGVGLAWLPFTLVKDAIAGGELVIAGDHTWRLNADIALYRRCGHTNRILDGIWSQATSSL